MTFKNKTFGVLTGGGSDSLDSFAYAALTIEDAAYGMVNGLYHPYNYDPTLVIAATSSPYYIVPADNATGTGAWVLSGFQGATSHVSAYRTTTQSIPNNTSTTVIFASEEYDSLGEFNTTTGVFTAKFGGLYLVNSRIQSADVSWSASESTQLQIWVEAALAKAGERILIQASVSGRMKPSVTATIALAAGEVLEIKFVHDQGAAINIDPNQINTYLMIDRLVD